jgi:AcrR family transcriptional regulator
VAPTSKREQKNSATRARIAKAALDLFVSRGFAETTIDQIAAGAGVGRRTIFRHFATKEAILFDHLVVRRDAAVEMLRERPTAEPALVSLHAVLRELCVHGYDRRALVQIRKVVLANPGLANVELTGVHSFENNLAITIQSRIDERSSPVESYALVLMALSWLSAAVRIYLNENRPSLVDCFDEISAACLRSATRELAPLLGVSAALVGRRTRRRKRSAREARSA